MTKIIVELRDALVKSIGAALNETKQGIIEDFRTAGINNGSSNKEVDYAVSTTGAGSPVAPGELSVTQGSQTTR